MTFWVSFLTNKNGGKSTHCRGLPRAMFPQPPVVKDNLYFVPDHYIALLCMSTKQLSLPTKHFSSETPNFGLHLLGCCNNITLLSFETFSISVFISLQIAYNRRLPSQQSWSTAMVFNHGDSDSEDIGNVWRHFDYPDWGWWYWHLDDKV